MIGRTKKYLETSLTPIDLAKSRARVDPDKLNVGWCSLFPPTENGAAAVTYYFVGKLMQEKGTDVYAVPYGNRIDKKLFPGIGFAKPEDSFLDAIVFFCLGVNLEKILGKAKAKTVFFQTIHEAENLTEKKGKILELAKAADLTVSTSKWAKEEFKANGLENVENIPLGVDTELFSPKDGKSGFEVLFVNRAHYAKGILPFLDSIPFVLEKHPEIVFRVHAPLDRYSPHAGKIAKKIKETKKSFSENFFSETQWTEFKEMPEKYFNANVLVFPSNNEGFGVPLVEAMASGIPCIAADKPPMNEIVEDGKTGFCVPLRKNPKYGEMTFPSPEKIAEKVCWLKENSGESEKMGKKARKKALEEYSLDKCAKLLAEELRKVAEK